MSAGNMLDASGIVHIRDNLFLVAEDELDHLRVFEFDAQALCFNFTGAVYNLGDKESDFESLACNRESGMFYATGSYGQDYSRRLVGFRFEDDPLNGVLKDVTEYDIDVETVVDARVNIESLALWQDRLMFGYREPSRGERAVALITGTSGSNQLLFALDLAGRTFRDMDCLNPDNYFILAGPEKGKDYERLPAQVYWWNGDIVSPELVVLDLDLSGVRAEGLAVRQTDQGLELFIGTDESKIKQAQCFDLWFVSANNPEQLRSQPCNKQAVSVHLSGYGS